VISIAELAALVPLSGAVIRHAEYFVDPALSFAQGWNYVFAVALGTSGGKYNLEAMRRPIIDDMSAARNCCYCCSYVVLGSSQ
jgi:hypothetical protein